MKNKLARLREGWEDVSLTGEGRAALRCARGSASSSSQACSEVGPTSGVGASRERRRLARSVWYCLRASTSLSTRLCVQQYPIQCSERINWQSVCNTRRSHGFEFSRRRPCVAGCGSWPRRREIWALRAVAQPAAQDVEEPRCDHQSSLDFQMLSHFSKNVQDNL